jgi:hypothetical protein
MTTKKCIICGREFESYDKPKEHGGTGSSRRPHHTKTCSKKCAKKYNERKR